MYHIYIYIYIYMCVAYVVSPILLSSSISPNKILLERSESIHEFRSLLGSIRYKKNGINTQIVPKSQN